MKQSINSICNSIIKRNQTMKYLLMIAMFFSLTTSVLAEGGSARVIEYTYSHKIRFVDPSNHVNDLPGISNPQVGVNITGGADCVPGIANCVGGSNTYGPTWRVFYNNGVLDSVQDGPVARRVVPGKYYNPTDMSKTDKTFSNLTSLTYTLKKGANTVWSITFNYTNDLASTSAASPYTFFQFDALTGGTLLGQGSIHRDNEGAIHFTSAPLITSTLDENAEFELTVTPTVTSATIVSTPGTATYLGEAICATAPKSGETKYSSVSTNHEGWYLMNGTPNANITNVNARAAAQMLFGGELGNLPNMDGLYTVAETTSGQAYTPAGNVNHEVTVSNVNIHAATLSTTDNGNHSHTFTDYYSSIPSGATAPTYNYTGSSYSTNFSPAASLVNSTSSDGQHNHNVTIGTVSPTPISIQPRSAKLYQFVYLGH